MEKFVEITMCRLCLSNVTGKNCDIIDKHTREILGILLPKWNLDEGKHFICKDCSTKLLAAFDFKGTCVNTEDCIFPYLNSEKGRLDLREIYLIENDSKLLISDLPNVCRLCMNLILGKFIGLEQLDVNMLNTYIPEINFSSTKDPVICQACYEAFQIHSVFLTICLNDGTSYLKTEEVDFKLKEGDLEIGLKTEKNDKCDLEEVTLKNIKTECKVNDLDSYQNNRKTKTKRAKLKSYTCDRCDFETSYIKHLLRHLIVHIHPKRQDVYHCHRCDYMTKLKNYLVTHQLVHLPSSKARVYKCDKCEYESTFNSHLIKHWAQHTSEKYTCHKCKSQTKIDVTMNKEFLTVDHHIPTDCNPETSNKGTLQSQLLQNKTDVYQCDKCSIQTSVPRNKQIFKCDKCSYETRLKCFFKKHQQVRHGQPHKEPEKVEMYKCNECSYKAKKKTNLIRHGLVHKDPVEIQMFKCDECTYETKHKTSLLSHNLRHRDPSEVRMYECDKCNFKTKDKTTLTRHELVHKDPSEIQMYKCDKCNFKTKNKPNLLRHELVHKDPSELEMHKCNDCYYRTSNKWNLRVHMLKHKDPSEIQMYKCDECGFKTKHKASLRNHMFRHRDPSEIQMYKCDECNYKTSFKSRVYAHKLIHRDPSERQMYKCEKCECQYKNKANLKHHLLKGCVDGSTHGDEGSTRTSSMD